MGNAVRNQQKLMDVRHFGATGNGTTDDTAAINAAATAAGAWGVVVVPPGTYRVTASVTPLSGQRWSGGGKLITDNGFNFNVFDLSGKTDVTIEHLRAESGTLGAAYTAATARFVSAKSLSHRCVVRRCHITGFQSAIQFNNSTDCKALDNVIVSPYGWGVNVQTDADDAEVRGNRITGAVNEHGIYVAGSSGNNIAGALVTENWVSGCAIDGIKVSYADDTLVRGNRSWSNGGEGVYVTVGSQRSQVLDNLTASNTGNGVIVYTGTTGDTVANTVVARNVVRKNQKNGISVTYAGTGAVAYTWVQDNDVDDNDQAATGTNYGIVLGGGASNTGAIVRGNRVMNEAVGVRIAASVPAAVIGRNIYVNCTAGTSDAGASTVIET